LSFDIPIAANTQYKLPQDQNARKLAAYTSYAFCISSLLLKCANKQLQSALSSDAEIFYTNICLKYDSLTFQNTLSYIWDLGIPVMSLKDPGTFHGACWRIERHSVIAIKRTILSQSRWLFDLLHEYKHAVQNQGQQNVSIAEQGDMSSDRRTNPEEIDASQFSGDVILAGNTEEIVNDCEIATNGKLQLLKSVVSKVAKRYGAPVGAVANYMAYRLSLQDENWWGTVTKLQTKDERPWEIAMKESTLPDKIEILCSTTDCETELHCYKPKRWKWIESGKECKACGDKSVDWDRVRRRNLSDIDSLVNELKREWVRNYFWAKSLDNKSIELLDEYNENDLRESIGRKLSKKIGIAES